MTGRRGTAPCGHDGEHVIGQFVTCSVRGCDGLPGKKCKQCGSGRLEAFTAPLVPDGAEHCLDCGKVRWSP